MTAQQLTALKTELITDPSVLGYAAPFSTGQDWKLAELINTRRSITLKRADVSAQEILQAIDYTDLVGPAVPASPTPAELRLERLAICFLTSLSAMGLVRLQNADSTLTPVGTSLNLIIKNPSNTRTRILAVMERTQCSRAEQVFGYGAVVTSEDVSAARLA